MSTDTWQQQDRLTLAALPNAPYWARRFIEEVLPRWHAATLVRNAQLVVTEFVTNAMRATTTLDEAAQQAYIRQPKAASFQELARQSRIALRLSFSRGWLLLEVADESTDAPEQQMPNFSSDHGRGLFLANAYCERWGWYPTFAADLNGKRRQIGKVAWAEMVAR